MGGGGYRVDILWRLAEVYGRGVYAGKFSASRREGTNEDLRRCVATAAADSPRFS